MVEVEIDSTRLINYRIYCPFPLTLSIDRSTEFRSGKPLSTLDTNELNMSNPVSITPGSDAMCWEICNSVACALLNIPPLEFGRFLRPRH